MMKGYNTGDGYMGLVEGRYILFASESEYYDYMNDQEQAENIILRTSEVWYTWVIIDNCKRRCCHAKRDESEV